MRYGHPQQTQIVGRVPIGVGLLAASLTGEVLAPARPKRAAARATLARIARLHDRHEKTMLRFDLDAMQEYIATVYIITKKGTLSSVWLLRASPAQGPRRAAAMGPSGQG